jgi:hypothetical protein
MKITKEQFDKLYTPDITKKEYDEIIALIDKRFEEICAKFMRGRNRNSWCSYDNVNDEFQSGVFDPTRYKEYIRLEGQYFNLPPGYDNEFPTRWLWEDFEEELEREIKEFQAQEAIEKENAKAQKIERKKEVILLKQSIKAKLTKEEWKIIKFKE